MLEKPDLPDQAILNALWEDYALRVRELRFLPIGNDASSYVYRVETESGPDCFLKVKPGRVYPPAVLVPRFLCDLGLPQVVAPLPTRSGRLTAQVNGFALILYPFIPGRTGMDQGLTPAQWTEFGEVLRRIHAAQPPPELAEVLEREDFRPVWGGEVREYAEIGQLAQRMRASRLETTFEHEMASFWAQKETEIQSIVSRCNQLAAVLRTRPHDLVLCHTDIHTANILVDPQGGLHIIDWDDPRLAPREHDLFFIGGSLAGDPQPGPEEAAFLAGYRLPRIDPLAMTFYHYVWAVQEIGDYASRVFASQQLGGETLADSVRGFKQLFDPSDVIAAAYRADRALLDSKIRPPSGHSRVAT